MFLHHRNFHSRPIGVHLNLGYQFSLLHGHTGSCEVNLALIQAGNDLSPVTMLLIFVRDAIGYVSRV